MKDQVLTKQSKGKEVIVKLTQIFQEHRALWHYFTTQAEAEAATICGPVGIVESSPRHVWSAIVRFDPVCAGVGLPGHDDDRCAIVARWCIQPQDDPFACPDCKAHMARLGLDDYRCTNPDCRKTWTANS